jgi:hypothetical protein
MTETKRKKTTQDGEAGDGPDANDGLEEDDYVPGGADNQGEEEEEPEAKEREAETSRPYMGSVDPTEVETEEAYDPEEADPIDGLWFQRSYYEPDDWISQYVSLGNIRHHALPEANVEVGAFLGRDNPLETELVGVATLQNHQFIKRRQRLDMNVVLLGWLYGIVHYRHDMGDADESRGPRYGDRNVKRTRREYNRIFMFAGLDGQFFCLIFNDESSGRIAFGNCRRRIAVGRVFAVINPFVVPRSCVRGQMTTVTTGEPVIPLHKTLVPSVPRFHALKPARANMDSYFCYHGIHLNLYGVSLKGDGDQFPPSCNGCLCDRRGKYAANSGCGCYDIEGSSRVHTVVMEYKLSLKFGQGLDMDVREQRSLRVTQLFVGNLSTAAAMHQSQKKTDSGRFRVAVRDCCQFINTHGGFTVTGTLSYGQIEDMSDQNVKTAGDVPTIRVAYLWPTDVGLPKRADYKQLMYLGG